MPFFTEKFPTDIEGCPCTVKHNERNGSTLKRSSLFPPSFSFFLSLSSILFLPLNSIGEALGRSSRIRKCYFASRSVFPPNRKIWQAFSSRNPRLLFRVYFITSHVQPKTVDFACFNADNLSALPCPAVLYLCCNDELEKRTRYEFPMRMKIPRTIAPFDAKRDDLFPKKKRPPLP